MLTTIASLQQTSLYSHLIYFLLFPLGNGALPERTPTKRNRPIEPNNAVDRISYFCCIGHVHSGKRHVKSFLQFSTFLLLGKDRPWERNKDCRVVYEWEKDIVCVRETHKRKKVKDVYICVRVRQILDVSVDFEGIKLYNCLNALCCN